MTRQVLITGGTGFLGSQVVAALLAYGADVTVLGSADTIERLGGLGTQVALIEGDVWNPASLRGRGRGFPVVIHLIGGLKADPKRGLTFRHLNTVSTRHVAQMAMSDGVAHFMFLSAAAGLPGVSGEYLISKHEAEGYLRKTGLNWTIFRAPPLFEPGNRRSPFYMLLSGVGRIPLIGGLVANTAPIAVHTAAYAIASLAVEGDLSRDRLIGPGTMRLIGLNALRKLNRPAVQPIGDLSDTFDDVPFGWLP